MRPYTPIWRQVNSKLVLTENAQRFVGQRIFRELCQDQVLNGGFSGNTQSGSFPIELADQVQGLLIAPATANFIAKIVCGVSDDVLSLLALSIPPRSGRCIIAPAANPTMYKQPALHRNLAYLRDQGYVIVEPQYGHLSCNTPGANIVDCLADQAKKRVPIEIKTFQSSINRNKPRWFAKTNLGESMRQIIEQRCFTATR